ATSPGSVNAVAVSCVRETILPASCDNFWAAGAIHEAGELLYHFLGGPPTHVADAKDAPKREIEQLVYRRRGNLSKAVARSRRQDQPFDGAGPVPTKVICSYAEQVFQPRIGRQR